MFLLFFNRHFRQRKITLIRLKHTKRYTPQTVNIFDKPIKIVDSASFLYQYNEIFITKIYLFKSNKNNPKIIDGGSNIGLAIIFWKSIFPQSSIISFEPDINLFNTLKYNVTSLNLTHVELINKGLWDSDKELFFIPEGADAGRISNSPTSCKIKVTSLRNFLNSKIDFLKLDIEGAEVVVLNNCKDLLINVENIFIEYHSFEKEPQKLNQLLLILQESGFRYIIKSTGVYSSHPYLEIKKQDGMDLQLNIFASRL